MDIYQQSIDAIYEGWRNYQKLVTDALAPLTPGQLALRAAPHLRTIEEIATHMIGARARWFDPPIGDGDQELETYRTWDRDGEPLRNAEEIVRGLQYTADYIHQQISSWTEAEWQVTLPEEGPGVTWQVTKQWIIWHLIEHDLHHGGEIALTMGIHNLKAPEI